MSNKSFESTEQEEWGGNDLSIVHGGGKAQAFGTENRIPGGWIGMKSNTDNGNYRKMFPHFSEKEHVC